MNTKNIFNKLKQFNILLFISIILSGTLLPSYISFGYWIPKFNEYLISNNTSLIILIASSILIYYLVKLLYLSEISRSRYIIIITLILVTTIIFRIWFIFHFDQDFSSDFKIMWDYAINTYTNNSFIPPYSPQTQRPLFSLVPLVLLFGKSEVTFKLANIIFISITALISTHLTDKWVSTKASIIVFILISLVPETYFSSIIPTHDIPGSFYLIICLLLTYKLFSYASNSSIIHIILYSSLLIVFGFLLELQRGLFYPFIISSLLTLPLYFIFKKETNRTLLFIILIFVIIIPSLGVYHIKSSLQQNNILFSSTDEINSRMHYFCFLNTFTLGTHNECKTFYDTYANNLTDDDYHFYRKAITISDLYYNGSERIPNYLGRSERLYSLGTQGYFYYHNLRNVSVEHQKKLIEVFKYLNTIYVAPFVILLFISSIYLFIFKLGKIEYDLFYYQAILITSIVTGTLLLIGENQPRYLFFGWFLWPIVIATFIDHIITARNSDKSNLLVIHKSVYIITLLLTISLIFLFKLLSFRSEFRLVDMASWDSVSCNFSSSTTCESSIIKFDSTQSDKQFSTLKLMLPEYPTESTFTKVQKEFDADEDQSYQFSIFAQSPYSRKEKSGSFDVSIIVNGETERSFNIADSNKYRYFSVKPILPRNGKIVVELQIQSNINYKSESWQKASLVNFKFASLRPYIPINEL